MKVNDMAMLLGLFATIITLINLYQKGRTVKLPPKSNEYDINNFYQKFASYEC